MPRHPNHAPRFYVLALAALLLAAAPAARAAGPAPATASAPRVRIITTLGVIELQLDPQRAPVTVANFLKYVRSGFYDGTLFHRVIPGFMIQGGGFEPGMVSKQTGAPIKNEAGNGLENLAGTIAMARTADPDSASSQFFINLVDNPFLDHRNDTPAGWGYAVFGRVIEGMDVVRRIAAVPTTSIGPFQNVPKEDVVIIRMEVMGTAKGARGRSS